MKIDTITKAEVVLSECDYKNACSFLTSENADNRFGKFLSVKGEREKMAYLTAIKYEKAFFLHDDVRGMLFRIS